MVFGVAFNVFDTNLHSKTAPKGYPDNKEEAT